MVYQFRFRTPSGSTITFFYLKVLIIYLHKFRLFSERNNRVHVGTVHVGHDHGVFVEEVYQTTLERQHLSRDIKVSGLTRLPGLTLLSPISKLKCYFLDQIDDLQF